MAVNLFVGEATSGIDKASTDEAISGEELNAILELEGPVEEREGEEEFII